MTANKTVSPARLLLPVAAVVPLWWFTAAQAAEPAAPIPTAARFLGPEGEDLGVERLAAAISRAGVPAQAALAKWTSWRQPPATGSPWLCGVTAGFGERAHAYAFRFDAAGAVERLAHVPYGKTTLEGGTRVWRAPVDSLADVVAHGTPSHDRQVSGPAVRITIVREQAAGDAGPVVNADVYEVIAWAAACEAGWTPTTSTAPAEATLAVAAGVKSASLRLAIESDGRRRELVKRSVHEDDIHAVLRRMFSCLAADSLATDFLRLGSGGELVATAPERLVCLADKRLLGLDTGAFRARWGDDEASRTRLERAACVPWRGADGAVSLVQWRPSLARIDPADGRAQPLAPVAASQRWSFDLDGSRAVVASGTAVALFENAQEAWRHAEADVMTCGPVFAGRLVVAGTDEGELLGLDGDSGAVAWRLPIDRGLRGRPTVAGTLVVVYCREGDALVAVDAATGKKAWSHPLGDVPIGPPVATPSGLLVASKSNRVALLDPDTGTVRAERTLPGWIVDVIPLSAKAGAPADRIAALTRDGVITLLGAANLEPAGSRRLAGRPGYGRAAGFIAAAGFPVAWLGPESAGGDADAPDTLDTELESSLADRADCLLADDDEGYAWIIPRSRLLETPR
jgi:hypothetical protein